MPPNNPPPIFSAETMICMTMVDGVLVPDCIDIVVEGEPRVQQRARMAVTGGVHMYDPTARTKRDFKAAVTDSLDFIRENDAQYPFFQDDDVKLTIVFHVHNMNKDVDNLLKFVLDALRGVVYIDDRSILKVVAEKRHDLHGFTEMAFTRHTAPGVYI
jgi:Holliday junction resolvase RusA-like endonuclease